MITRLAGFFSYHILIIYSTPDFYGELRRKSGATQPSQNQNTLNTGKAAEAGKRKATAPAAGGNPFARKPKVQG